MVWINYDILCAYLENSCTSSANADVAVFNHENHDVAIFSHDVAVFSHDFAVFNQVNYYVAVFNDENHDVAVFSHDNHCKWSL